jgi:SAM-dependent methyltransferase
MTSLTDSSAIFSYHRDMIGRHGLQSSFALGWRDRESQLVRFKALSAIADLSGCSILDAGCGYGDLLPYLSALYGSFAYTGIEQVPELLDEAIERYGTWPGATFIPGNFTAMALPAADYVFASGSLNYGSAEPGFIFKMITKLFEASRRGFAFNLLSDIIPNGLLVAYDPERIVRFCKPICREVKLTRGYAEDDFTVFMYR